jgi:hypothetical protein
MDREKVQPQRQPEMKRPEMNRPEARRPDPGREVRTDGGSPPAPPSNTGGTGRTDQTRGDKPAPNGGSQSSPSSGMLLKVLAIIVLAVVGWLYFGRGPAATYAGAEESAPNYQKNKNANPSIPAVFSARDIDRARTEEAKQAAQRGDPIPGVTNPSPAFLEAVKKGEVTFYAVRAYDTCAEDGDVVTLHLPIGADIGPIPLTIAGTTVSVPVVTGQPAQLTVIAVKDGVGGVTLGVQTSGGVWFSEVMPVGGSETMPLAVQ